MQTHDLMSKLESQRFRLLLYLGLLSLCLGVQASSSVTSLYVQCMS